MRSSSAHIDLSDLELAFGASELRGSEDEERVRAIQDHLSLCAECAAAAEMHKELNWLNKDEREIAPGACPPPHVWYELAGGVLPAARASELLAHAADCSACAVHLRDAQEDLDGLGIEPAVTRLQSSDPHWQDELARHLSAESHKEDARDTARRAQLIGFPRRRIWASAIAAMLLLGFGWTGWKVHRESSDDALLAQAYDVQRRTDLRLPGGDAVPLASVNRGSGEPPLLTQLLRLRLRAQEHLDRDANNPYWHVVLGRIALVENNGERAKREFETALALDSGNVSIKAELAAAYFQIGEGTGDQEDFAHATDLYGQMLDHPPGKVDSESLAMLYFNRALSWDRQSIYHEAIQDYEQALKLEHDRGWREEIERRLNDDKEVEKKSATPSASSGDRSPGALLSTVASKSGGDEEYELYLAAATRDWLPRAGTSLEVDAGLRALAALGISRHDTWLADMLPSAKSKVSQEAAEHLSKAVEADARGNADAALSESAIAAKLFGKAHNKAGILRAEVEQSYGYAREGRANDCLAIADPLLKSNSLEPYVWLHVYLLLNRATCSAATGDVEQYRQTTTEAMLIARKALLPLHVLRAEGFLVESASALGDRQTASKLTQQGLRECAAYQGTRMRSYEFLEQIYIAVKGALPHAAAGVADAASYAATLVSNLQIQAYALEMQGRAETAIAHDPRAAQLFEQASTLLRSFPSGRAADLYKADWEADRAELLAQSGHVAEAVSRLRQADDAVAATDNYAVRQVHHTEFARLLLMSGDFSGALLHAAAATRDAERALGTTDGEAERLAWERTNGHGYLLLVQGLASTHAASDALRAWEWYRAAPYRKPGAETAPSETKDVVAQLPPLMPERLHVLTLIVGRVENEYVVWSVEDSPSHSVRMVHVTTPPQQLEQLAQTLTDLCADRNSSEQSIRAIGRELFKQLFGPLWQQLSESNAVQLDLDRSLQDLPIAAFVQPDGRYFGLAHTLLILPAWWSVQPAAERTLSASPRVLLVEGKTTGIASRDGSRARLADQYLETNYLQTIFPAADVLRSSDASTDELEKRLPKAEVFHYIGHTVATERRRALLIGATGDSFDAKAIGQIPLGNLRLAVLAACSSTGGLEAGVNSSDSITHALLRAGAGNVIATLWDVDTLSFRDLMERLYANLREHHQAIADALRLAQQSIHANALTAHPFYWASTQLFER